VPFYKDVALGDFLVWGYRFITAEFLLTVVVEYLVIYLMLGRPSKARMPLLFYLTLVNLITNPATQLGIFFVADPVLLGSSGKAFLVLCLIELVAMTTEFCLLTLVFGRMYRRGVLKVDVTAKRTVVIVFAANVASFLFGFVGGIVLMKAASTFLNF